MLALASVDSRPFRSQSKLDLCPPSECFWPPVIQPRSAHEPGKGETDRQEVMVGAESSPDPKQQQEAEAKRSLLDEVRLHSQPPAAP